MKTSEVLKHAKQLLAEKHTDRYKGRDTFICLAITNVALHTKRITKNDVERCKNMIASRLEGKDTMEGWLCANHCLPKDKLTDEHRDRIQQHRHAWLDMLIAEFEAKGD